MSKRLILRLVLKISKIETRLYNFFTSSKVLPSIFSVMIYIGSFNQSSLKINCQNRRTYGKYLNLSSCKPLEAHDVFLILSCILKIQISYRTGQDIMLQENIQVFMQLSKRVGV